jgi:hypothetical protein
MKIWNKKFWNKKVLTIAGIATVVLFLGGVLYYQLVFQKPTFVTVRIKGSPGNWWWVTPRPPDWLANAIHVGDKEYNAMNQPIADVVSVDLYDAGGPTKDIYLTAKLDARYNAQTKKYRYKGEPLEVGGPISLSLGSTFFPGMVVGIDGPGVPVRKYKDLIVHVRYKDRWPFEYEGVVVGDKISDGEGNVIAEIMSKESTPAEREVETAAGQVVRGFSPVLQDLYVTIKLKVETRDDQYVYREEQYVKIGNQLWLLFPHYNISGAYITSIE